MNSQNEHLGSSGGLEVTAQPDEFHAHEALHVAHVLQNMIAHELEDHPFVLAHREIAERVENVQRELGYLYQAIGEIRMGE